jgi:hypothetical protein
MDLFENQSDRRNQRPASPIVAKKELLLGLLLSLLLLMGAGGV